MLQSPPILAAATTPDGSLAAVTGDSHQGGNGTRSGLILTKSGRRNKDKKKNGNIEISDSDKDNKMSHPMLIHPLPPSQAATRSSSLRTLLNDSRDVMENLKALFGLLDGKKRTGVPDEFPDYFNKVFDRTCCTSLTQSTRYPSCEGLEEMDHDDLYIDFVLNFQSSFKATVKEVVLFRPPQVIKYTIRLVSDDTDVTFTAIAYIGGSYGKIVRTERQETHYSITPLIKGLKLYFALFTGEMPLADQVPTGELRTRFNAIYHQSLTVIEQTSEAMISSTDASPSEPLPTTTRTIEYNEAYSSAVRLLENGAKIDLLSVRNHQDGLEYAIRFSLAGGIHLFVARCVASVENGRIVRIASCPDTCTGGISLGCATEKGFYPHEIQAMNNLKNLMALFQGKHKTPYDFPRQFACTFEKAVEFIQAGTLSVASPAPASFDDLYNEFLQFAILRKKVDITSMERVSKRVIAFTIHAYNQELDSLSFFVANVGRNGKLERLAQQGATKYSIFPLIKNFRAFMALFTDETQNQQHEHGKDHNQETALEERLNSICDPSIVIETSRGCVGYKQILKTVLPSWLEKGRKTTVLQLKRHENGLEYTLRHSTSTHEVTIRSIALVEQGKIVRVVSKRENEYGDGNHHHNQDDDFVYHNAKPINSITVEDRNNVIQKMQVYFGLFRHQAAAAAAAVQDESKHKGKNKGRLLAAMVDLFDPFCFELTTTNGPVYFEWFKKCELQKFVRGLSIDWNVLNAHHPKGILYELYLLDDDNQTQKVRVLAILRGGKIVRLEAIENAEYYNLLYPQSRPCLV